MEQHEKNMLDVDLVGDMASLLQKSKAIWPVRSNRASSLDDKCTRKLVYLRTRWNEAKPIGDYLAGVFNTAKAVEPIIGRILAEAGENAKYRWRIIAAQQSIVDRTFEHYLISGTIDGILQADIERDNWTSVAVIDIKALDPNTFRTIKTFDDFQNFTWSNKWIGQLMLYAFGLNLNRCLIILVNRSNLWEIRPIWFDLDLEKVEQLLQKAKTINEHVANETLPEKINQPEHCLKCDFAHICLPDLISKEGLRPLEDDEIEGLLRRREEIQGTAKEYEKIEAQLKKKLIDGQDILCGQFLVEWQKVEFTKKPAEAQHIKYFKKTITKLDSKPFEEEGVVA